MSCWLAADTDCPCCSRRRPTCSPDVRKTSVVRTGPRAADRVSDLREWDRRPLSRAVSYPATSTGTVVAAGVQCMSTPIRRCRPGADRRHCEPCGRVGRTILEGGSKILLNNKCYWLSRCNVGLNSLATWTIESDLTSSSFEYGDVVDEFSKTKSRKNLCKH